MSFDFGTVKLLERSLGSILTEILWEYCKDLIKVSFQNFCCLIFLSNFHSRANKVFIFFYLFSIYFKVTKSFNHNDNCDGHEKPVV